MSFLDSLSSRAIGLQVSSSRAVVVPTKIPVGSLPGRSEAGKPLYTDWNGDAAILGGYLRNLYVYRCVNTRANSLASLPFRTGDQLSRNIDLNTKLAQLLGPAPGSPNPLWSSAMLWRYSSVQYDLLGKYAWKKEYDPDTGEVIGLWPLRAQHLNPILNTNRAKMQYFEGYEYMDGGQKKPLKYEDVVYVWRPSQQDPLQPETVLQAAGVQVNTSKVLAEFDFKFLDKGGITPYVVVSDPFVNAAERDAWQSNFIRRFTGKDNVPIAFAERQIVRGDNGQVPVDTFSITTVGSTRRDAQLDVMGDRLIKDITIAFGTPVSMLGDSSDRTYANGYQEDRNYCQQTLRPLIREHQDGINKRLAMDLGTALGWFDTSEVPALHPLPVFTDADAPGLIAAGIITRDEYRADRGLMALTPAENSAPPASAPPLRGSLEDSLARALEESGIVKLTPGETVTQEDIVGAVTELAGGYMDLTRQVEKIERERAELEVRGLIDEGLILPSKREVMTNLRLVAPETFKALIPDVPLVRFSERALPPSLPDRVDQAADNLTHPAGIDLKWEKWDANACEICTDLDGKTVQPSQYPYGNAHPNCRCSWQPTSAEQVSLLAKIQGILKGLVVVLFGDQKRSVDNKLRSRKARATLSSVDDIFDVHHWGSRYNQIIGPTLKELGLDSREAGLLIAQDIVTTRDLLTAVIALRDDPDEMMRGIEEVFSEGPNRLVNSVTSALMIDAETVRKALLDIHRGAPVTAVLESWQLGLKGIGSPDSNGRQGHVDASNGGS